MIAKNGDLGRIVQLLGSYSNRYIVVDKAVNERGKYTFELSKNIIERGNFEDIKAALKDAIDFDMYKERQPIRKTYIKFLE
jgi:hypothetical protein